MYTQLLHKLSVKARPMKRSVTDPIGWRPVAADVLNDMETTARTSRPIVWHHDKMKRRDEQIRKRKEKKRAWLRHMYSTGMHGGDTAVSDPTAGEAPAGEAPTAINPADDLADEDLDELLAWSGSLDFDSYHANWLGVATSSRA